MDMYQKRKIRKEKRENSNQNEKFHKVVLNWYPGHMAKAKNEIKSIMPVIDIVYELIDARIPSSSKIKDINDIIKNKDRILIMTKADLCDLNETMKWVKKYENDGYKVILANLNNTKDITKIMKQTEEIINKINDKNASKGLNKRKIKSLVIGIPNVGKSTFINYLAAKKVASVGNNPGITKNNTWLNTKYNMLVLDTPGILWPKLENKTEAMNLASTGAIKSEILPVNDVGLYILEFLSNYYPCILKEKYGINKITSIEEDYKTIADKLNVKSKIEDIDYQKINNIIINDIKSEKTKNITLDRG